MGGLVAPTDHKSSTRVVDVGAGELAVVSEAAGAGAPHTSSPNHLSFAGAGTGAGAGVDKDDASNESHRSPDGLGEAVLGSGAGGLKNEGVGAADSGSGAGEGVVIGSGVDHASFSSLLRSGSGSGMGSGVDHALSPPNRSELLNILLADKDDAENTHNCIARAILSRTAHVETTT